MPSGQFKFCPVPLQYLPPRGSFARVLLPPVNYGKQETQHGTLTLGIHPQRRDTGALSLMCWALYVGGGQVETQNVTGAGRNITGCHTDRASQTVHGSHFLIPFRAAMVLSSHPSHPFQSKNFYKLLRLENMTS